jgi:CHAD domain
VRIAEFYSYEPIVGDEGAAEALHNLRIAAKRLRYTLELFRAAFGESGERQIERVKAIQEELGNLHDADVRIGLIQEELTTLGAEQTAALGRTLAVAPAEALEAITASALRPPPDDPRRGLVALLGREYGERKRTYQAFAELWARFAEEGMRAELVALSATPAAHRERAEESGGGGAA